MLNGNFAHGIERLSNLREKGTDRPKGCCELLRFSAILFSTFAREKMKAHGNYDDLWCDEWQGKVVWREEHRPPEPVLGKRRSLDMSLDP